jgi:glycosyltransferase involved in cell wall biosynthesis
MYESDTLPCGLHENIHEFEAVLVPSRQCVEMFSRVHPHVFQVPLGISPTEWPQEERPPFDGFFNVFMPGQGQRKGTDVAFRVFQTAFPKNVKFDPEPHLLIKGILDDGFSDERMEKRLGVISTDEERTFYRAAHVSLNLSRGEGWGLMPMQSISMGIPTILSNAHGHAEFAYLGLGVPCTKVPAGVFLYGDSGQWWEPDFDTAVDLLRDVYHNYDAHRELARRNALACHEEFSWDRSAQALMAVVGDSDFIPRGLPYYATARLFLLRVTRYVDPAIAGVHYEFERNHDYYVPADVRRVLQDAGYLEESCLADQTGQLMEAV